MATWRERFEQSLLDYVLANREKTTLLSIGSVDEYLDSYICRPSRKPESPAAALRALAVLAFQRVYREFEEAMERTESPIEIPMLLALTLAGRDRLGPLGDVYFSAGGRPAESDDYEFLSVEPQAQLGDYRVDFLVTFSSLEPIALTNSIRRGINAPDHIKRLANPREYSRGPGGRSPDPTSAHYRRFEATWMRQAAPSYSRSRDISVSSKSITSAAHFIASFEMSDPVKRKTRRPID